MKSHPRVAFLHFGLPTWDLQTMKKALLRFILVASMFPALAAANDGIAGVSAGGIAFRKTDAIAIGKSWRAGQLVLSRHIQADQCHDLSGSSAQFPARRRPQCLLRQHRIRRF
jgi:hypothetical protein